MVSKGVDRLVQNHIAFHIGLPGDGIIPADTTSAFRTVRHGAGKDFVTAGCQCVDTNLIEGIPHRILAVTEINQHLVVTQVIPVHPYQNTVLIVTRIKLTVIDDHTVCLAVGIEIISDLTGIDIEGSALFVNKCA